MEKIVAFMEKHIVPTATKIGHQRHLIAIRNGFLGMIALTMLSSICILIRNFPSEAYKLWLTTSTLGMHINDICQNISWGTFSFMAIFSCFGIADSLWKSYDRKGIEGALVAVAIFMAISPQTVSYVASEGAEEVLVKGGLSSANFGATALFTAIIVALLSVEILNYFYKKDFLKIKLPDAVPPAVARSFESMLPGMVTLTLFIAGGYIVRQLCGGMYLNDVISTIVQTPLQGLTDSLGSAILIPFGNSFFWTLGLHGQDIMSPITTPLLTALSAENMALASAGATTGYNTITSPFFYAFVWHGGSGATIGLMLAMILGGKKVRQRNKAITSLAIGPSIFNINEPVIFGVPIVLNPIYAIPFIMAPIINSVISYFAIISGLVAPTIVQSIPWVTPAVLSGFLATGHWTGALLSGFTFILSIIIYLPFVKASLVMEEKEMAKKLAEAKANGVEIEEVREEKKEEIKEVNISEDELSAKPEIRIMLACAGGMSTSLLAKKMQDYARARGYNVKCWAIGISAIPEASGSYDILLLGPQVKHLFDELRGKADTDKPVEVIKSQDYGTMNAEAVIKKAFGTLNIEI